MKTAFNIIYVAMFFIGVVTTLSLITIGLVYIGGQYEFISYYFNYGYQLLLLERRGVILYERFFGIYDCWCIGWYDISHFNGDV